MNLQEYQAFVESVSSPETNNFEDFLERVQSLDKTFDVNLTLLLNSAIGMAAEAGEFAEVPKKVVWQGKPLSADVQFHMKRELGDIIFYWMNACRALNLDPQEVIDENYNKLSSRYSGGKFEVAKSEKRSTGDV